MNLQESIGGVSEIRGAGQLITLKGSAQPQKIVQYAEKNEFKELKQELREAQETIKHLQVNSKDFQSTISTYEAGMRELKTEACKPKWTSNKWFILFMLGILCIFVALLKDKFADFNRPK